MASGNTFLELIEYRKLIGTEADWNVDQKGQSSILVRVQVIDVGNFFGNLRLCVKPVAGSGEKWVDKKFILIDGAEISMRLDGDGHPARAPSK